MSRFGPAGRPLGRGLGLGPGPEFDRIRAIAAALGDRASALGDDCALLELGGECLALSTDVSVEQVHFRLDWLSLGEVGYRAAAAALSDLAAEGAEPLGALVALTAPAAAAGAAEGAEVVEVMRGVGEAAERVGARVLGGDLSSGPAWAIAVSVVGRAPTPVTRAGARPGDSLWVTGELGAARAALEAWRRGERPPAAARAAFARPEPRVAVGRWLARHGARAMLDLSDGLAGDAGHLAAASAVELELDLDSVPVAPVAVAEAERRGEPPARFAAEGGEDYELLAALPPEFTPDGAARCLAECGMRLTRIGMVGEGSGVRFRLDGGAVTVAPPLAAPLAAPLAGYQHFR